MKKYFDDVRELWHAGKIRSFYHIRSLGDLQFTPQLSKRVLVAYKKSDASEVLPKTFYIIEENSTTRFYTCLIAIIIDYNLELKGKKQ